MASDLPVFRRMVKVIGEHERPRQTAYRYELVEFQPSGRFIVRPAVFITDTQMRADDDRVYETQDEAGCQLISAQEFKAFKAAWDALRKRLGYEPVDEMGTIV